MDLGLIAAGAAALLASKAGESFAAELGKASWERVTHLVQSIRRSLVDEPTGATALAEADADPENDAALGRLAAILAARAEDDSAFAAEMVDLVQAAEQERWGSRIVVAGQARVGKIVTIGNIDGDVSF